MKVLLIRSEFKLNGPGVLAYELAKGLRQRGVDVLAASSGGAMAEAMAAAGIHHVTIPALAVNRRRPWDVLHSIRQLAPVIRSNRIDIIHGFNGAATMAARLASLFSVHAVTSVTGIGKEPFYWLGPRRLFVVSEHVRRRLRRFGIRDSRMRVLNPAIVDPERFAPRLYDRIQVRQALGIPQESQVGVYVAVMAPGKGHELAIRSARHVARQLPAFRLLMVGDGPERPALEALTLRLGVQDQVIFAGFRRDVPALMGAADLLIHSPVQETFGIVLIEAGAMEIPVVATAVGGIPEVVENGKTGLLVPPGDPVRLADAVVQLLRPGTQQRRRQLGIAGRQRVELHYTLERTVDKLLAMYRELGIQA